MKKVLFSIAFCALYISAQAQIKPKTQDWFFYDYTYDSYLNAPDAIEQNFIPNGHTLSFLLDKGFGKGNFAIAYGIDYSSQSYYSNMVISTDISTGDEVFGIMTPDSIEYNRMYSEFLDGLFELRFRSTPNSKGKFYRAYLGVKAGVRVQSFSRLRTEKAVVQFSELGSLNRYRVGAYTRIGYGWVNLYAYYGLTELFDKGALANGTDITGITPLSVGLSIHFGN